VASRLTGVRDWEEVAVVRGRDEARCAFGSSVVLPTSQYRCLCPCSLTDQLTHSVVVVVGS
jgi:hypothetical protein